MLKQKVLHGWEVYTLTEFIFDNSEISMLVQKLYKEEIQQFRKEIKLNEKRTLTPLVCLKEFIEEVLDYDTLSTLYTILKAFVKEHKLDAALIYAEYNGSLECYIVGIHQVVPTTQQDLEEFIRVYMREVSKTGLEELAIDKILKHV